MRSVTEWTRAGDNRYARLISYIHHTSEFKQHCHVGNTARQCRLGLFQHFDFAGDFEDSKSTSVGNLCIFGSCSIVPVSSMCKKRTSVSPSSTEAEIFSLDAGLRKNGIPALDFGDLVTEVFHSSSDTTQRRKERALGDLLHNKRSNNYTNVKTKIQS